ncbi:Uncharacterised protein [Mycobacteroides abscessus subsp. abscessus]|nr:Uncharacterised protein [Mycobacteroides abscessus subsp. abscessus]
MELVIKVSKIQKYHQLVKLELRKYFKMANQELIQLTLVMRQSKIHSLHFLLYIQTNQYLSHG